MCVATSGSPLSVSQTSLSMTVRRSSQSCARSAITGQRIKIWVVIEAPVVFLDIHGQGVATFCDV